MEGQEVFICGAVRTPTGLFGKSLREFIGVDLAVAAAKELVKRTGISDHLDRLDDVILGEVYFRAREEINPGRLVAYYIGAVDTPGLTMQRACAVGLEAVITGSQKIATGQCEMVIAGGAESMTNVPFELYGLRWGKMFNDETLYDVLYSPLLGCPPTGIGMGMTAENLADRYDITREQLDEYAVESHRRASVAWEAGVYDAEVVPLEISGKKRGEKLLFSRDEGMRPDSTVESLGTLKPVFKEGGKVTAGNACPLNDAAATLLLASGKTVADLGLEPLARMVSYAVVGVDPDYMGYGPVPATKKALDWAGLTLSDIDFFEVNEAFASVPITFMKELGVPHDLVNTNGGAIALGHPIGATGAKLATSAIHRMHGEKSNRCVVALCQGGGMGTAAIFERVE